MYKVLISWKGWVFQPTISNTLYKPLLLFLVQVYLLPLFLSISYLSYATHPKGLRFQYVRESFKKPLDKTTSRSYLYWEGSQGCLQKAWVG